MPTPNAADSPTMVVLRGEMVSDAISFMPVIAMVENTVMVAPPSTHCGIVVKIAENLGIRPASSKNPPAKAKTTRLTTLFVVTIPTFCE